MPAKKEPLKPGTPAPNSGQYVEVGPRGGKTDTEVTGVKGKRLPPTSKPGNGYVLIDPTNNGAGGK
ncbi:YjzC family protein [Nocardia abscessus]|uniref:YjzC family protein n=1 Tax=Nocardia TaxID=1817 RepID=UPI0018945600|nr:MULTISPECIES: YjzC family protein [Nocardia]MBF6341816.1 YjzC family protein [Nocardia abscessus]MDE1674370.1 YjzC family protein [Nocardia gipuzkoensis]